MSYAWAISVLFRWQGREPRELDTPLLRQALREMAGPLGRYATDNLCDLEGRPLYPPPWGDLAGLCDAFQDVLEGREERGQLDDGL